MTHVLNTCEQHSCEESKGKASPEFWVELLEGLIVETRQGGSLGLLIEMCEAIGKLLLP